MAGFPIDAWQWYTNHEETTATSCGCANVKRWDGYTSAQTGDAQITPGTINNFTYGTASTQTVTATQIYYQYFVTGQAVWYPDGQQAYYPYPYPAAAPETPEEMAARQLREAQRKEQEALAVVRSEELLDSLLSDRQREQWKEKKYFEVEVGQRIYRLRKHDRVRLVENGVEVTGYCIGPYGHTVPYGDTLVAQKLWLEAREADFLKTANHFDLRRDVHIPNIPPPVNAEADQFALAEAAMFNAIPLIARGTVDPANVQVELAA